MEFKTSIYLKRHFDKLYKTDQNLNYNINPVKSNNGMTSFIDQNNSKNFKYQNSNQLFLRVKNLTNQKSKRLYFNE